MASRKTPSSAPHQQTSRLRIQSLDSTGSGYTYDCKQARQNGLHIRRGVPSLMWRGKFASFSTLHRTCKPTLNFRATLHVQAGLAGHPCAPNVAGLALKPLFSLAPNAAFSGRAMWPSERPFAPIYRAGATFFRPNNPRQARRNPLICCRFSANSRRSRLFPRHCRHVCQRTPATPPHRRATLAQSASNPRFARACAREQHPPRRYTRRGGAQRLLPMAPLQ